MEEFDEKYVGWNPWHGCTKISPGCRFCYVYRQDAMYGSDIGSDVVRKTAAFDLPLKLRRDKSYKIPSGSTVFTCFSSDFLLDAADEWRSDCWRMMRVRRDCMFYFFTKRIDRFAECLPPDWADGYPNVIVGCTVENQAMAEYRLPIFKRLPIKHKTIIVAPMLEAVNLASWLDDSIEMVAVSGESGAEARECRYEWVLDVRRQCIEAGVAFSFHQTGANFVKDGVRYAIARRHQISQARRAAIDVRIASNLAPVDAQKHHQTEYVLRFQPDDDE